MAKKKTQQKKITKPKVKPDVVFKADETTTGIMPKKALKLTSESIFKAYSIMEGSPNFIALGVDFAAKYDRLQKLIGMNQSHINYDDSQIVDLDKQLVNTVIEHFRPVFDTANINKMLVSIAADQKIVKTQPSMILKLVDGSPVFYPTGLNGIPIKDGDGIVLQYPFSKMNIAPDEAVVKIFEKIANNKNVGKDKFSFVFAISPITGEIVIRLLETGRVDLKYGERTIETWLST